VTISIPASSCRCSPSVATAALRKTLFCLFCTIETCRSLTGLLLSRRCRTSRTVVRRCCISESANHFRPILKAARKNILSKCCSTRSSNSPKRLTLGSSLCCTCRNWCERFSDNHLPCRSARIVPLSRRLYTSLHLQNLSALFRERAFAREFCRTNSASDLETSTYRSTRNRTFLRHGSRTKCLLFSSR